MKFDKLYPPFREKIEESKKGNNSFRVLISFKDNTDKKTFQTKFSSYEFLSEFDTLPYLNLELTKQQIETLDQENLISKIEEDQRLNLSIESVNEFIKLNKYKNSQIVFTGKGVSVGLIDTGVYQNVKGLSKINIKKVLISDENIVISDKLDKAETAHGTLMAGILVNRTKDKNQNFLGIAPNIELVDFDISNQHSEFYLSSILKVIDYIFKKNLKIDILFIPFETQEGSDGEDCLSQILNSMVDNGFIIVCPSGNFGPDYSLGSPGAAEKVFTIGALEKGGKIANFSRRTPTPDEKSKPDFYFPGKNIIINLSDEIKVMVTGSSAAASIGVGIIALLKEYNPELSPKEVSNILNSSCIDLNEKTDKQAVKTISIAKLFKDLGVYQDKIIPYNYLVKKSFIYTFECLGILLILILIFLNYQMFIF
ncbi:MAG: putative Subtilisin [Promethearchaeota archaeon]|nr:MAG: putative Subtilisin [Candidatus Lokiarchaeota archaeon]